MHKKKIQLFAFIPKKDINTKLYMANENVYSTNTPIYYACMYSPAIANCCLVGLCTLHRADYKQARGRELKTDIKTPTETHTLSAMHTYSKSVPKT